MAVSSESIEKAFEQEAFYKDKNASLMMITLFLIGITIGLGGVVFLVRLVAKPPPIYFPTTSFGALLTEQPLERPGIENTILMNFVVEAVMAAHTFNFVNYTQVMDASSIYFTKEGYESYKSALINVKILDRLIEQKFVLRAIPTDAPQILLEKPFAGRYMWKIKVPMRFKYQNVKTEFGELIDITLIVMRVPTTESPNGVSILKMDLEVTGRG